MNPRQYQFLSAFLFIFPLTTKCSNLRTVEKRILDTILSDVHYDKRIRPTAATAESKSEGPCVVRVNIYLRSISRISDLDMEYTVQMTFREQWFDKRLQFDDMGGEMPYLILTDPDRLWKPDLFFSNEKQGHFHNLIMPNVLLRIYPNGEVLYSIRVSLVLACPMDLKYYPLDKQICMMRMASYGYTTEDLIFLWKDGDPVQITKNLHLPRFSLQNFETMNCSSQTNTGDYSCLKVEFLFKREFSYYLIQIYIPCVMLVIVSWVSFWLDPNAIPARVSLGVTTLLTMATQISGINASLPPVSYTKAIDVWTGVCLTFVFGALLEFALVNYASRRENNHTSRGIYGYSAPMLDSDGNPLPQDFEQNTPFFGFNTSCKVHQKVDYIDSVEYKEQNCYKRWLSRFKTRSKRIDVFSRIFFPTVFTMFNFMYWFTYLFREDLGAVKAVKFT